MTVPRGELEKVARKQSLPTLPHCCHHDPRDGSSMFTGGCLINRYDEGARDWPICAGFIHQYLTRVVLRLACKDQQLKSYRCYAVHHFPHHMQTISVSPDELFWKNNPISSAFTCRKKKQPHEEKQRGPPADPAASPTKPHPLSSPSSSLPIISSQLGVLPEGRDVMHSMGPLFSVNFLPSFPGSRSKTL